MRVSNTALLCQVVLLPENRYPVGMLDWFTGFVGYDASRLTLSRIFKLDRHGVVTLDMPTWEKVSGTHVSSIQVTRRPAQESMITAAHELGFLCSPHVLKISGNPSKFLQGHNVTGPSVSDLADVLKATVREFSEGIRPPDAFDERYPAVKRSRLDITTAVDLGSHDAVHEWLHSATFRTRSRHGRAMDSHGTVYWGKNSRRWSMKAYCKHCELKAHKPDVSDELLQVLSDWTRTHLRIELCLRTPELKDRGTLQESIIWEYFSRIEVHDMKVKMIDEVKLAPPVRAILMNWHNGEDVTMSGYSRKTLYRYRKAILEETGIDVLLPAVEQSKKAAPTLLGLSELKAREVVDVPSKVQASLFGAGR